MNTSQSNHHGNISSSSSTSCKSSCDNEEEKAAGPRVKVEWRPVSGLQNGNGTQSDNVELSVTVVINPPEEEPCVSPSSHQASSPAR